jgi:hypothetical protein
LRWGCVGWCLTRNCLPASAMHDDWALAGWRQRCGTATRQASAAACNCISTGRRLARFACRWLPSTERLKGTCALRRQLQVRESDAPRHAEGPSGLRASVAPPEASASVNKHDAFALASTSSKKRAHNSNGFAQCVRVITLAQSSSAAGETRPSLAKT